jgi:hypothetical protein
MENGACGMWNTQRNIKRKIVCSGNEQRDNLPIISLSFIE